MANIEAKAKKSARLFRDAVQIKKQVKIARSKGMDFFVRNKTHGLAKQHLLSCDCWMCANPRRTEGDVTLQEKSFDALALAVAE